MGAFRMEASMFPGGPGKEGLPLERCMRFLPHHQVRSGVIARQAAASGGRARGLLIEQSTQAPPHHQMERKRGQPTGAAAPAAVQAVAQGL